MTTTKADKWFLSLEEGVLGPLTWMEVEERVRAASAEDSACVRADGSEAWKPYKAVKSAGGAATAQASPSQPAALVDEESVRFCETAVRLGIFTPEAAHQVLEQRRVDRTIGYSKSIFAYVEEHGLLTVDQIAAVVAAQKTEPARVSPAPGAKETTAPASGPSWETVKSKPLKLSTLFPVRAWLADRPWANHWVQWFGFYALYPIALGEIVGATGTLGDVIWALGAYFAVLSGFILYLWLRPASVPMGRMIGVAASTAIFGGVLVIGAQQSIPILREFYAVQDAPDFGTRLLGCIFGTGILEETTKILPILWLFLHKKKAVHFREIVFLGAVSGLAFGVLEAVQYSYRYAIAHASDLLINFVRAGQVDLSTYGQFVVAEGTRLVSLPLLHGLFTAITAVFVAFAASVVSKRVSLVITGLLLTATLHGLYDAALYEPARSPWLAMGVAVLTLLLFVVYSRSGEKILERVIAEHPAPASGGAAVAAS